MPTIRVFEFDVWREGYAGAEVSVKVAGTDTLASIFTDEALSVAADNPQTLVSQEINERQYGKFAAPLYTSDSYYLDVDGLNVSGVIRPPLQSLDGEDASLATVQSADGTVDVPLEEIVARSVHVDDFGEFLDTSDPGASAGTNNDTLTAAINAVSANGGFVELPPGTYAFESVELPTGVRLRGKGQGVTILQSQEGAIVIELGGAGAGLIDLTIDGVLLTASSVGIYMKAIDGTVFDRATIKRFATGIYCQGAHGSRWRDLTVEGCTINAKLHGDTDSDDGGWSFTDNHWTGICITSVTIGLDLEYIDAIVAHNSFCVGFEDNALIAVKIRGARYTDFDGSWWEGNGTNLDVDDFLTGSFEDDNTVLGLWLRNFSIDAGDIVLAGDLGDVTFDRGEITGTVEITLTVPGNAILARDVVEGASVTIAGDGTKWLRWTSTDHGASSGLTTDATVTKAWSIELEPGQRAFLVGTVIGNSRNTDTSGEYYIAVSARRPPSTLAYDTQTANFTAGLMVTGGTSGATGRIVTDTDGGATGTLELRDIIGAFVDNELLTDSSTGSATVNGTLTAVNAELLGAVTALRAAREDTAGWDATFVANGPEIHLDVLGAASTTIEWLVHVDVVKT
jgi:hypothetical protein